MRRKAISLTQLAKNPEVVARDIDTSGAIYRIKCPGQRMMVLMHEEAFEGWLVVAELSGNPDVQAQLEQSRRDSAAGLGRTLDEIEKERGLDRQAATRRIGAASRSTSPGRAKGTRRSPRSRRRAA